MDLKHVSNEHSFELMRLILEQDKSVVRSWSFYENHEYKEGEKAILHFGSQFKTIQVNRGYRFVYDQSDKNNLNRLVPDVLIETQEEFLSLISSSNEWDKLLNQIK
tara:strand:- start:442 stop:759 length:318 start_codon:yes stop_codon:yes gene_type:complete